MQQTHRSRPLFRLLLLVSPLSLMPTVGGAVEAPSEIDIGCITWVMAQHEDQVVAGTFVADSDSGWIYFVPPPAADGEPTELERWHRLGRPVALGFADRRLFVLDAAERALLTIDLFDGGLEVLLQGDPLVEPANMAVAPDGLAAIYDRGRQEILWLAPGGEPRTYSATAGLEPQSLLFSAWDTLQLLDGREDSLVTLRLVRLKGGELRLSRPDTLPLRERNRLGDLRTLTSFEGVTYVADSRSIFAFIDADQSLVRAYPGYHGHGDIRRLAVSPAHLWILDGGDIHPVERTIPVDLSLEGDPQSSQEALLSFYRYLDLEGLLPTREAIVRRPEQTLGAFLYEEGVLILWPLPPVERRSFLPSWVLGGRDKTRQESSYSVQQIEQRAAKTAVDLEDPTAELLTLLCQHNRRLCATSESLSLESPVRQGTRIVLPALEIESHLRRRRVELEGRSVEEQIDRLNASEERRVKGRERELLIRLNPNLRALSQEELLTLSQGTVALPAESWSVTAMVPAREYEIRSSGLRRIDRLEAATLVPRASVYQKAMSHGGLFQPPPDDPAEQRCQALRQHLDTWWSAIHYPVNDVGEPLFDRLELELAVAILESEAQTLVEHHVFNTDSDHPTWHTTHEFALRAVPLPASLPDPAEVIDGLDGPATGHHGTHVAAIIGGRRGRCWSGLLPASRLVLIDTRDFGLVRRRILDASDADTRVFNISQKLEGWEEEFGRTVEDTTHSLFVVAAGNDGRDLNDVAVEAPAPIRFGQRPNVVGVTAVDWAHALLPSDNNFGSRLVDLAAPGLDLLSATGRNRFGPATGTSQATPQVAAAAAVILSTPAADPGDTKARLIATADWKETYEGRVWGGLLDFQAAVRFPDHNVVITNSQRAGGAGTFATFQRSNNPKIEILNAPRFYERSGTGSIAPDWVRFEWILSLERRDNGKYRMVYKDPPGRGSRLHIILDAVLREERRIQCEELKVFDPEDRTLTPDPLCDDGLQLEQIAEYTKRMPYDVRWE